MRAWLIAVVFFLFPLSCHPFSRQRPNPSRPRPDRPVSHSQFHHSRAGPHSSLAGPNEIYQNLRHQSLCSLLSSHQPQIRLPHINRRTGQTRPFLPLTRRHYLRHFQAQPRIDVFCRLTPNRLQLSLSADYPRRSLGRRLLSCLQTARQAEIKKTLDFWPSLPQFPHPAPQS